MRAGTLPFLSTDECPALRLTGDTQYVLVKGVNELKNPYVLEKQRTARSALKQLTFVEYLLCAPYTYHRIYPFPQIALTAQRV